MSRTVRTAAALLILAILTCGSLGALPFGPHPDPARNEKMGFLTGVMKWIVSILAPDRPAGDGLGPEQPKTKEGTQVDPHGGG